MPDLEAEADLNGDPPLLEGHPGTPRHRVKGYEYDRPPKEVPQDPSLIRLSDLDPEGWPEPLPPQPRRVTVESYTRRNPRRRTMSTSTEPTTRTETTALKDAAAVALARNTDPATSHEAAKVATGSLRRRMIEVLAAYQDHATFCRGMVEAGSPHDRPGFTDEELVDHVTETQRFQPGKKASPSGIRTARKDLCRAGLLEPKMLEGFDVEDTRPTRLGNPAIVYALTDAGAALDLAGLR